MRWLNSLLRFFQHWLRELRVRTEGRTREELADVQRQTREWMDSWDRFLSSLEDLARAKLRLKREHWRDDIPAFSTIVDSIISTFRNEHETLARAIEAGYQSRHDAFILDTIGLELQGAAERNERAAASGRSDYMDNAVDGSIVVLDSIEHIIRKLPWWLQNLTHILREMLGLLRGTF